MLQVRSLCAGWGPRSLLDHVSFTLDRGERAALLGPNGAGKTTLLDVLAGRLPAREGTVVFRGRDMAALDHPARAREGLALLPQEPSLFRGLSLRENLEAACHAPSARRAQSPSAVDEALERWGLRDAAERPVEVLSGGERRRGELARSLLLSPSVLLLDEPFAGLDPAGRSALADCLGGLPSAIPWLLADHLALEAVALSTRVLLLVDGRLAADVPRDRFDPASAAFAPYFGRGLMHRPGQFVGPP